MKIRPRASELICRVAGPYPELAHTSDLVEHPETGGRRHRRLGAIVGRKNFIAGTDCGLRAPVHPKITWVKLCDGLAIASKKLWSWIQKCLVGMSETRSEMPVSGIAYLLIALTSQRHSATSTTSP